MGVGGTGRACEKAPRKESIWPGGLEGRRGRLKPNLGGSGGL